MKLAISKPALVLAAALSFSIPAGTAVASVATATSGSAEATLFVWDTNSQISYIRDLGISWTPQTVTSVFSSDYSFGADSTFAAFIAELGGQPLSTTRWAVVSAYTSGGQGGLLATRNSSNPAPTVTSLRNGGYTNSNLTTNAARWEDIVNTISGITPDAINRSTTFGGTTADNGSILTHAYDGFGEINTENWRGGFNNTSPNLFNVLGGDTASLTAQFYYLQAFGTGGTTTVSGLTPNLLGGTWSIDALSGALSYTAVPAPGAGALLLTALGFVARAARKRRASVTGANQN